MKFSRRFRKFFRATSPEAGAAGDTQPWTGTAPDIDSRIAEWTEIVEGGVPPASVDGAAAAHEEP